jgi:DNA-binding NarL/FixJ family response regulator
VAIRLVLADDHPVVLAGLAQVFSTDRAFEVVACTNNGAEALAAVRTFKPDVLVLDLRMPVKDGVTVLREMKRDGLTTPVVILTAVEGRDVMEAIQLGARGVVLKDMAAKLLLDAVRRVHTGGTWIEREAAGMAIDQLLHPVTKHRALSMLTPRELEVACMTAQGFPNKTVAERLSITEGTAKLHLHHVYEKLGIDGRMALVRYLRSHGVI